MIVKCLPAPPKRVLFDFHFLRCLEVEVGTAVFIDEGVNSQGTGEGDGKDEEVQVHGVLHFGLTEKTTRRLVRQQSHDFHDIGPIFDS